MCWQTTHTKKKIGPHIDMPYTIQTDDDVYLSLLFLNRNGIIIIVISITPNVSVIFIRKSAQRMEQTVIASRYSQKSWCKSTSTPHECKSIALIALTVHFFATGFRYAKIRSDTTIGVAATNPNCSNISRCSHSTATYFTSTCVHTGKEIQLGSDWTL